jgi:hypothetical protein
MTRLVALTLALGLAACATPSVTPQAADAPAAAPVQSPQKAASALARFAGTWEGTGTATEADGTASARQLFMNLVLDDAGGFALGWATLIDADRDAARLRKTVVQFTADGMPGSWTGFEQQAGGTGNRYSAGLDRGALIVAVSGVNADGLLETQTYARRFDEAGLMQLAYSREVGGKTVRRVTGTLRPAPPPSTR